MYILRNAPFYCVYEGADDADAAAKAAETKAAADKALADADKVTTQDQLNSVLKREKDKFKAEREKMIAQLETIQGDAKTTAETKAALETQLEELRRANMSTEEKAKLERAKLEKDYTGKLTEKEAEANQWKQRHDELQTGYSITSAANIHGVVATGVPFLESYLKPRSKMVEIVDSNGKGLGRFDTKVTLTVADKDGKAVDVEYSVGEAVKQMKDMPEQFGFLFASSAAAGLGAGTGTPGKPLNIKQMGMEKYMEARKKNPTSVGL